MILYQLDLAICHPSRNPMSWTVASFEVKKQHRLPLQKVVLWEWDPLVVGEERLGGMQDSGTETIMDTDHIRMAVAILPKPTVDIEMVSPKIKGDQPGEEMRGQIRGCLHGHPPLIMQVHGLMGEDLTALMDTEKETEIDCQGVELELDRVVVVQLVLVLVLSELVGVMWILTFLVTDLILDAERNVLVRETSGQGMTVVGETIEMIVDEIGIEIGTEKGLTTTRGEEVVTIGAGIARHAVEAEVP